MSKACIVPFLSFTGQVEAAMRFYAQALPETSITTLVRYGTPNPHISSEQGDRIMYGAVNCMGQEIIFLDMSDEYPAPAFNWAQSLYIDCQDEAYLMLSIEIDAIAYATLNIFNMTKLSLLVDNRIQAMVEKRKMEIASQKSNF
ncbi:MAG TPA: VOC family protein [Enterococcus sp.]|nr:VOC family protein [Enterococcus sp.]